jgi:hypothetical protein
MGGTIGLLLIMNKEEENKKKEEENKKKEDIYGGKYINSKYLRKTEKPRSYYKREIYYYETEIEKR